MVQKKIHLKYQKHVVYAKAFVGSSNLYTQKTGFFTHRAALRGWGELGTHYRDPRPKIQSFL